MMLSLSGRYKPCFPRRGFTLVELMVVICIVAVLATVAFDRLLLYTERAEKAAMDATLAATKMGLQIRLAELIMSNQQMAAAQLERENPIRWLAEPPSNYLGEYNAPLVQGNWYFASDARQLVYLPKSIKFLQFDQGVGKELRFQAKLYYYEIDIAGAKARTLAGISLLPVRAYSWF